LHEVGEEKKRGQAQKKEKRISTSIHDEKRTPVRKGGREGNSGAAKKTLSEELWQLHGSKEGKETALRKKGRKKTTHLPLREGEGKSNIDKKWGKGRNLIKKRTFQRRKKGGFLPFGGGKKKKTCQKEGGNAESAESKTKCCLKGNTSCCGREGERT